MFYVSSALSFGFVFVYFLLKLLIYIILLLQLRSKLLDFLVYVFKLLLQLLVVLISITNITKHLQILLRQHVDLMRFLIELCLVIVSHCGHLFFKLVDLNLQCLSNSVALLAISHQPIVLCAQVGVQVVETGHLMLQLLVCGHILFQLALILVQLFNLSNMFAVFKLCAWFAVLTEWSQRGCGIVWSGSGQRAIILRK